MQLSTQIMLFTWQTVQIICVYFNVSMLWYRLLIMEITYVLNDVRMDSMQTILQNNVYLNVLQFRMILLLKTHHIFVWANVLLVLLEVRKIFIVLHNVGGQILLIKQQDYVLKHVQMDTLLKIKQHDAIEIVIQTRMQIQQQKDVFWIVLICMNFSNWIKIGVV